MKHTGVELRLGQLAGLIVIGVCGVLAPLILPLVAGAAAELLQVRPEAMGYLAAAEMTGAGVGSLAISAWAHRLRWRWTACIAFLAMAIVNIVIAEYHVSYSAMIALRFVTGIGAGLTLGIASAGLGASASPEKSLATFFVCVFLTGTVVLKLLPPLIENSDATLLFWTLAGFSILGLLQGIVLRAEPRAAAAGVDRLVGVLSERQRFGGALGVASVLLFFTGVGAIWSYFAKIGENAGLTSSSIATGLSIAGLCGGAGALAALFLPRIFGRQTCLWLGLSAALMSMIVLQFAVSDVLFALAGALVLFGWNLAYPFMLGLLANLDSHGRYVAAGVSMSNFGFAAGPSLASLFFGAAVISKVAILGSVFLVLCAMSLILVVKLTLTESARVDA